MERLFALTLKAPVLLLILISAMCAIAGEYVAKRWSMQPSISQYALGVLFYAAAGAIFMPCLLREKLIVAGFLFDIVTNTSFLLLGFLVFHERFTRLQFIGACFGIISLLMFIAAETLDK